MNFTSCLLLWAFREIPVFTASTVLPWHRHLVLTPQDPSQPHPQDDLPEVGFLRPRAYPFFSKERALRKDWSTYPPTGSVWGLWVKCCLWKKNKQTKKQKKQDRFTEHHWISESSYFLKVHLISLSHAGIFSHIEDGELKFPILPPPWNISNVNFSDFEKWDRMTGENSFSVSGFGVTERPALDQMPPSFCKIKRCKKIPCADCQVLS